MCGCRKSRKYMARSRISRLNLDLTCLGFSANCHMEPMLSRMIRDLPADFISLCIGINIMGGSTLSKRTFAPAFIGFIQTIREKHPTTPRAIMSPVYCKEREEKENKVGLNLVIMRAEITRLDRKSTRLNSSHVAISYAVFCLKKKNNSHNIQADTNPIGLLRQPTTN